MPYSALPTIVQVKLGLGKDKFSKGREIVTHIAAFTPALAPLCLLFTENHESFTRLTPGLEVAVFPEFPLTQRVQVVSL